MSRLHLRSLVLLLLTTLIWGTTFPILKDVVTTLSPAALVSSRFLIAALLFLPFCRWHHLNRRLLRDGSLLGLVAFLSYLTQVIGLETVSANRAAFITSLNVVIVPLLSWLLGRGLKRRMIGAAGLAFAGIAVMSWEAGAITWGDLWVLGCALSYAVYILLIEAVADQHPPLQLTAVQLISIALLGLLWALPSGWSQFATVGSHWNAILYLGVIATAVTTLSQVLAQRHLSATEAAIIYTLEPVFAALFSFWWLAERLNGREAVGASMILAAMLLSQIGPAEKT
jgi:drug/metabolite transporter (DMT)-like permease